MQNILANQWVKKLLLAAIVVFGLLYFSPQAVMAQGLSIPTGTVEISKDIVQGPTFGDTVLAMVNYFTGFLEIGRASCRERV